MCCDGDQYSSFAQGNAQGAFYNVWIRYHNPSTARRSTFRPMSLTDFKADNQSRVGDPVQVGCVGMFRVLLIDTRKSLDVPFVSCLDPHIWESDLRIGRVGIFSLRQVPDRNIFLFEAPSFRIIWHMVILPWWRQQHTQTHNVNLIIPLKGTI